ncbi:MAG: HAD-IA family hydrolase [Bauldia sp.]|uniref:HAD-IA family hydrolase n=1 Tax=Bauldia sp. TaxID=2575872 RepID=UPI001DED0710|nr:HAD-IA family hydrolase [Bauldia sp.]MCB1487623.1 HAD-IA family hydrolase [Bauldia sp.]MCB1496365.1 HAD-IA family hydrolase [Bauldia sp.]
MNDRRPTLVFDLDGTLVDTASDLVATLNAILAEEGLQPVALQHAAAMVSHGARAMLARAFAEAADEARLDALTQRFIDHYSRHLVGGSRPFPGVPESLDRFAASGWRLAVCTNKLEGLSRSLLEQLDLAERFAAIAGQDTFGVRKPHPGHLTETIRVAGGDPRRAVMVGDSDVDVKTARAAEIPVVAVSFGYSPLPARELGADAVIDRYDSLYDVAVSLLDRPS